MHASNKVHQWFFESCRPAQLAIKGSVLAENDLLLILLSFLAGNAVKQLEFKRVFAIMKNK